MRRRWKRKRKRLERNLGHLERDEETMNEWMKGLYGGYLGCQVARRQTFGRKLKLAVAHRATSSTCPLSTVAST